MPVTVIVLLVLTGPSWGGEPEVQQARSREYRLKALFLLRFADYIRYPAHPKLPPDAFLIGVVGKSPILKELRLLSPRVGRKRKRRYRILFFRRPDKVKPCHLLFLPRGNPRILRDLRRRLEGLPVVLVGEAPGWARKGCVINFYLHRNRVRFEINLYAEQATGVKISARLLRLARIVRE